MHKVSVIDFFFPLKRIGRLCLYAYSKLSYLFTSCFLDPLLLFNIEEDPFLLNLCCEPFLEEVLLEHSTDLAENCF